MRVAGRTAFGRTAKVAVGVTTLSLLTFAVTAPGSAAPSAPAQAAPFDAGTGSAIAIAYKLNPIFGNLSFGITAGESVAGHQNTGSSAQSKAINLGVIGVTLAAEGCEGDDPTLPRENQPQPVIVNADDEGAAAGKSASLGGVINMSASANHDPLARAVTSVAPLGDVGSVFVNGGTSTASSGVVSPGVREARAITELADVQLLGGLVSLRGMRWEAIQTTGATTTNSGTFTLGSLNLLGVPIPLPTDALGQLRVLADTLGALGLTVTPPATRVEQGIVFVDPLTIGIIPAALRDGIIGPILSAGQDIRAALVTALFNLGCGHDPDIFGNNAETAVTVLDLALATISGAGRLTVELGGVQATTSEISEFSGLGVVPDLANTPNVPSVNLPPIDLGDTGLNGSPLVLNDPGDLTGANTPEPIADLGDGERGGVLLGVAGGGLLLLLLTAELDRRKMRRAQREILLEA
jgi:hypothetical protein